MKSSGIFAKLKGIKNIEMIVALVLCAIVLLFFFNSFGSIGASGNQDDESFASWAGNLETRMIKILSAIKGAGNVSVMISFENGVEQVWATQKQTQYENGNVTQTEELILVSGKPLLIKELSPKVKGVVIVASGAKSVSVKVEITKAAAALLDIPFSKIEIFVGG